MMLTILSLENKNLDDKDCCILVKKLHNYPKLRTLILSNNNIGDVGAKALTEELQYNKTISEIYLINNRITDSGAVYFLSALINCPNLRHVALEKNEISYHIFATLKIEEKRKNEKA
jgi:Ran GTPase-activating protein (RanGAP) involved in mRNA processing and transport